MAKKKKKKRTIGTMCNSRVMWAIKPVTKVKEGKKGVNDRKKAKEKLRKGDYNE